MGACPVLETERLVLRPFREDDVDAYTAVLQAPEVRAALHLADDVGRYEAWLGMAQQLGQWELRGTGQWALEERSTGAFVGRAGMHFPARADWPGIEIGWTLHPDHWGKGYATEAGAAARDYAFAYHDVDALYSVILPENAPSQAVARRLGFTPWEERVLSFFPSMPHVVWRLRRDEFAAGRTSAGRDVERLGDARGNAVLAGVGRDRDAVGVGAHDGRVASREEVRVGDEHERLAGHLEPFADPGDRDGPDLGVGERDRGCARRGVAGSGDGVAVRAGRGIPEQLYELLLDVGGDRVLPPGGLGVDLLPFETDDVDEEALGQAVAAHDGGGQAAALGREAQTAVVVELDEALGDEASDRLGDGGGRDPEPLHEPGPHRDDALLLEGEDRLEVLLGRVVQLGHGRRLRPGRRAAGADFGLHSRPSSANMG